MTIAADPYRIDPAGAGPTLYARAKQLIPGGTQLLSKRPESHLPDLWPSYYRKARGAEVWDLDGNRLVDMSYAGIGSCILGYADPDVNDAVTRAIADGSMTTLNCPEEVELAERLLALHPWAGGVRFTRTGGEAMAVAARIARAATRRDTIAFCGYHGWHDWYLAANLKHADTLDNHLLPALNPNGVPRGLAGTMHQFGYNRVAELETIVTAHGDALAAIVMEPMRHDEPEPGFLERVRELARSCGAALVFDEITAGWRFTHGGMHLHYRIDPDLAVFAKGMSNGFPMAAIVGTRDMMDAVQDTFISSTYWTERIGPTAALATLDKLEREQVPARLEALGCRVRDGWRAAASRHGIEIDISGRPALCTFRFSVPEAQAVRTLFTQEMLARGFLASSVYYAMFAHTDAQVDRYNEAVDEVFGEIAAAVQAEAVNTRLRGPVAHTGFRRVD